MHTELIAWYEATEQAIRVNKFVLGLRVEDSIECPLKFLYSYGNKPCVHAKRIMIMIKFCVVKRENPRSNHKSWASKYQAYMLADPLTKGLPPSVFRELTVDMGLWWSLWSLDIKAQNKYKILFQNGKMYCSRWVW